MMFAFIASLPWWGKAAVVLLSGAAFHFVPQLKELPL